MPKKEINSEAMSGALDAINEEATRLLSLVSSGATDLCDGLQLIISLSRYKHDIRSGEEIKRVRGEQSI